MDEDNQSSTYAITEPGAMSGDLYGTVDFADGFFYNIDGIYLAVAIFGGLAIVSNILAYLIGRGLNGDYSAKSLIKAQAVADTLQCLFLIQLGILYNDGTSPMRPFWNGMNYSNMSCKLHKLYYNFTPNLASLLVMMISADRAVAINFPIFYKDHGTSKNAVKFIIVPVVIVSFLTSAHHFIMNSTSEESGLCFYNSDRYSWAADYNAAVQYFYLLVVPVIVIANISIILGMARIKTQAASTKSVTWSLFILSAAFGVSFVIFRICGAIANVQDFTDPAQFLTAEAAWAWGNVAVTVNGAITAPIYLLMGPTMRRALLTNFRWLTGKPGARTTSTGN